MTLHLIARTMLTAAAVPLLIAAAAGPASAGSAAVAQTDGTVTRGPAPPVTFTPPPQGFAFQGLGSSEDYNGEFYFYTPGEPVVAVGPSDIVETVNDAAAVYDKSGNKLKEFDFGTFWGGTDANPTQCTDPRALYIASASRFAISCSDITNSSGPEPMRFAVSATSDPTGAWYTYVAPNTSFLDQDKIEATSDKFVIAGNTSTTEVMYVYNLSDVVNHVASPHSVKVTARKSNVYEAAVQQTATSPAYFVSSFPGNVLWLATVTGTPAAANVHLSEVLVRSTDFPGPQNPQVPGGSFDGGDGRVLDAVYEVETSDSKPVIQYSSTRTCGTRDCLTDARIDLSGAKPVLVSDTLVGEPGWDYTYGAVGLDAAGDVFEAYTRSSPSTGAGASVVGPGFDVDLQPPTPGASVCSSGSGPCFVRWGDYLGTDIDPSDPTTVWVTGLYQDSNGSFGWQTVIARVSTTTYSLPTVTTGAASLVKTTSAKVSGTVDPNGVATTYHVDYGLTTGYDSATAETSAGSGTSPVNVSAMLTGLQQGTLYHYRVVATTAAGRSVGADRTFKTLGPKVTSVVFTGSAQSPTVTVNGLRFGTEPAGTPAGCNDSGQDYGSGFYLQDVTAGWTAGQDGDCVGLVVSSYTATQVVYTFGSNYSNYGLLNAGDSYTLAVAGATFSGTVSYSS